HCFFFFFQAEDGIRDFHVTGVQTCALPISAAQLAEEAQLVLELGIDLGVRLVAAGGDVEIMQRHRAMAEIGQRRDVARFRNFARSEERRVGKECRSRWWADEEDKADAYRTE